MVVDQVVHDTLLRVPGHIGEVSHAAQVVWGGHGHVDFTGGASDLVVEFVEVECLVGGIVELSWNVSPGGDLVLLDWSLVSDLVLFLVAEGG